MSRGRPPTDPGLVKKALALVDAGAAPEEAAERLSKPGARISARTVYRALAARGSEHPTVVPTPPSVSGTEPPRRVQEPAQEPPARTEGPEPASASERPPRRPAAPSPGVDGDLEILDGEIEATRKQLRQARRKARKGGSTHGLASLGKLLADLVKRRAEIRPPPPPSEDEEERRWRADADAVLKLIEAGVVEAEQRTAMGRAA